MRGTIGIIGTDSVEVALMNKLLIEYGNKHLGFKDDQEFPEILAIGTGAKTRDEIVHQGDMCCDFGCDVIIIPEDLGETRIDADIKTRNPDARLFVIKKDAGREVLIKEVFEYVSELKDFKRPNLFFADQTASQEEIGVINKNIEADKRERSERIKLRKRGGEYSFLNQKIVFVLGGAGPLASSEFCQEFSRKEVPFIHYSVNSAPGKHRFETATGPSYIPHYQNAVEFFKEIAASLIAIPCNTAHKRLAEFCGEYIDRVVDIRKSVLEKHKGVEALILLGTNRTAGVDLGDGEVGIYEELRRKDYPDQGAFIIPDSVQQQKIMQSIYDVKAGNSADAKSKILGVIKELREKHGDHRVILGCTELPLPFTPAEMISYRFINPAQDMAELAKELLDAMKERDSGVKRRFSQLYSSSSGSGSSEELSESELINEETNSVEILFSPSSQQEEKSEVNKFRVCVYKEEENDSNNYRINYRIKLISNPSNQKESSLRAKEIIFLTNLRNEFQSGLKTHHADRTRDDNSYISFHKTSQELSQRIETWMKENGINPIKGRPHSVKQR